MKRILLATGLLFLATGCASLNKKFNNVAPGQLHPQLKQIEGKLPKEAVATLGEPISVGWADQKSFGNTKYYLAYVVGGGQTSSLDLMAGGDNLTCRIFFFLHELAFKHSSSAGDSVEISCGILPRHGYVYDDSMIK